MKLFITQMTISCSGDSFLAERILIVDDDIHVRELIDIGLSPMGYEVLQLDSAVDLIQQVKNTLPDVILLDFQMPEKDGLTALRELRAKGIVIPVIVLTGTADQNTAVQFFRSGATDFVPKPFDNDYLVIVAQRVIAHHSRNLIEKITEMIPYMTHLESCNWEQGKCTCKLGEVSLNALQMASEAMLNP